ncbi:MAG TPA: aldose 1-epimerase [Candidatus Acidoferrales bacterium]|nr:aldose 1-epimerase [Candidatus Acidoferrales bacterium]
MVERGLAFLLFLTATVVLQAFAGRNPRATSSPARAKSAQQSSISIGGQPAVVLTRPQPVNRAEPQFLGATVLPGNGMNLLQIRAYVPGLGDMNVLDAPDLAGAKDLLEKQNDAFGNKSFSMGAAILLPYPNRIRGKLSSDGKTIETSIGGKMMELPANWKGKKPGAEVHAMHGLIMSAHFQDVKYHNGPAESTVSAFLAGGNFDGHWPSKTDVAVRMVLKNQALDVIVTAKNTGKEKLPMAISFHPYFRFPSGDRAQARLHLPADERALVNNYDDVFPTGKIVSVKGTPYDFTAPGGAPLGTTLYMDDCFTDLHRNRAGNAAIEIIDPAAKYGLRLTALSPQIRAIQVYAPPDKKYVVIEPQFNLADPFNKKLWGNRDTGMDWLEPGQSVSWHVRLELFIPRNSPRAAN